jgi:hypothetical protein
MPRLRLNLKEFRDEISKRIFDKGDILNDIITYLKNEEDIILTRKTVQRRYTE